MRTREFPIAALLAAGVSIGIIHASGDNNYVVTTLVSNQPGVAPVTDGKLVNGWGIAASSSSPWWVADNGSGWATIYTGAGAKASLEVTVPGAPTGIVAYGGTQFLLAPNRPAQFIFASEDGTISAWNRLFDMGNAHVVFGDPDSVYKGLAIIGDTLYTTDFSECEVETLNGTFAKFDSDGGFEDESIPEDYCPFGIQAIGSSIFVTYALKGGDDDVAGQGHGFVREFDASGHLVDVVASHGQLNSPWGLALAPSNFGPFSGCLLVGNFGDGEINAYCKDGDNYHHQATLREDGEILRIDGLWGIGFGNNAGSGPSNVLYFAAGPDDESNGAFGKIEFAGK
jgi:uncharacterized protein (TIGR03118 family)